MVICVCSFWGEMGDVEYGTLSASMLATYKKFFQEQAIEYGSVMVDVAKLEGLGNDRRTFEGQELSIERLKFHFVGSHFCCVSWDEGRPSNMWDFIDSLYF